jgi:hypothetical protein
MLGARLGQGIFRPWLATAVPVAVLILTRLAQAAMITVTSNGDSGPGSLRQAIADAAPGDTIDFDMATVVSPIVLSSGTLVVASDLTISGPGPNQLAISGPGVDWANPFAMFEIGQLAHVRIEGLTIQNGFGYQYGSAIANYGTLTAQNCKISQNTMSGIADSTSSVYGGGIYNFGIMDLLDSTVSDNSFKDPAGEYGGGIANAGIMNIVNCTLSENGANSGAGRDLERRNNEPSEQHDLWQLKFNYWIWWWNHESRIGYVERGELYDCRQFLGFRRWWNP